MTEDLEANAIFQNNVDHPMIDPMEQCLIEERVRGGNLFFSKKTKSLEKVLSRRMPLADPTKGILISISI